MANLLEIKTIVKQHSEKIIENKKKIDLEQEMIDKVLDADSDYKDLNDQIRRLKLKLKVAHDKAIYNNADATKSADSIKDLRADNKLMKSVISDLLNQYQEETGEEEFEGKRIIKVCKLA